MSEKLDKAKRRKDRAKGLRNAGNVSGALQQLDKAIAFLREAIDGGEDGEPIWFEISDCFGIKGGIYSRQEEFAQALNMYKEGLKWEEKLREKKSTYNLSNVIFYSIIVGDQSITSTEIQSDLEHKLIPPLKVETEGSRSDDWWAWADLGQFYLLHGEPEKAIECYRKGHATGPTKDDYDSSLRVLRYLRNALPEGDKFWHGFNLGITELESAKPK